MNAHQIDENGLILNTVVVAELSHGMVDASIGGCIGDRVVNGSIVKTVTPQTIEQHNAAILAELATIDAKSIRPLREGDTARSNQLEQEAAALRLQLLKA